MTTPSALPRTKGRDPLELERLAEELAERESRHKLTSRDSEESEGAPHNLPLYTPLSHDNPYLSAENFNVEEFLLSRAYTSLPDLRSELRDYHAVLKEELVKLINDDYEAFISLSTDLRGEGTRMEKLKQPLGDLRQQVMQSRTQLQDIEVAVQTKLKRRSELREEKAFLHLLLKISESVTRLESLLLITTPDEDGTSTEIQGAGSSARGGYGDDGLADDRSRTSRAKHLGRVASEFTQLLYHVSKAKADKCAFVDEWQWRIDRIKSTLSSDLDHLFSTTLKNLTGGKADGTENRLSDSEKVKLVSEITECLRTYDALGLWRDAEEVLRRDVIHEFVKKTIHVGALSAPHSPIIPHTPLPPSRTNSARPQDSASIPLRTPYTPFTAFATKQNPFELNFGSDGTLAAHAHLLDDSDDPLAGLYNQILRYVERDMKRIMEVAEKASAKHSGGGQLTKSESLLGKALPTPVQVKNDDQGHRFEILANVIWSEIGRAVMDELGSIVFAVGKPDEFRKHYETTQAFIRSLEFLAPSVEAIEAMRLHPVYISFEKRWQLPVYFQLRWKEIVTNLEDTLSSTSRLERSPGHEPFVTAQAAAVWDAINSCWSAQVFIPQLAHRFWKFTLQLLSRYKSWLDGALPSYDSNIVATPLERRGNISATLTPSSLARSTTPTIPTEAASAESVAADEALLAQLAIAITDIKAMESQVWKLWREELTMMLPDIANAVDEDMNVSDLEDCTPDALRHSLSKLLSIIPPLSGQIIHVLSRRGCDALLPMRSIPSQFRAMSSSKRLPTEPSHFVSLILRPTKTFFGIGTANGPAAKLKGDFLVSYTEEVFDIVAQRYIYFLTAMKKTEESLRRLKKGKKSTYSLFGGSAKEDDGRADEEKIRAQMILDVEAFGKDAASLGVNVNESATYRTLLDLAHSSLSEDTGSA
ncbi:COG complex component [Panus rudis PR-1116 ss-1]|nr:COG complex component [Panus rudis PR-1116 ss-1]